MQLRKPLLVLLSTVMLLVGAGAAFSAQAPAFEINPAHLDIGTFFSGRRISLSGSIPSDRDMVIEIKGPDEKGAFNMKGRVGPFWMNRGKVELEKAPFLYMLLLPEGKEWHASLSSSGLGIEQLKQTLAIKPHNANLDVVFPRFVQLKQSEHLYGELKGTVEYSQPAGGMKHFDAKFYFPASTVAGEYRILNRLFHNGKVEETTVRSFTVEEVGFIKAVRELAYDRGLIYGILCVLIALFVGAVIGLLFRRTEAH
jgi:hypothetical protein